jgi:cell fate (sporulation/competence/biofilm development) regulator YlbF (YheA/YmcA/DUF963 family)
VSAYIAAQQAVKQDASANQLLHDYQAKMERIRRLEEEGKPIEVADKHQLRDLESGLAGHEMLKALMRAQADYLELMTQINREIDGPIAALGRPGAAS